MTECIGWVEKQGGKDGFLVGKQVQVWSKTVEQFWGSDIKSPISYGASSIQSLDMSR